MAFCIILLIVQQMYKLQKQNTTETRKQQLKQYNYNYSISCEHLSSVQIIITLYNWCSLLKLPRKWCSPMQNRGQQHFRGLTNPDVNFKRRHQFFCYKTICLTFIFMSGPNKLFLEKHCLRKSASCTKNIFTTGFRKDIMFCLW